MIDLRKAVRFLEKLPVRDRDSGRTVPFILKPNQQVLVQKLCEQADAGKPIRAIVCKSRRMGASAVTDALAFVYTLDNPGIDARIVAHTDDTVDKLFSVPTNLDKALQKLHPYLLLPKPLATSLTIPHDEGDSVLDIATAGFTAGGRGGGFFFLHISEAAFFKSPTAFTSLMSTVPDHANTAVIIESTSNGMIGMGEAYYKRWLAAVQGDSEYTPIFLAWKDDPAYVSDPSIFKRKPLDKDEREVMKQYGLTLEQMAWRRRAIFDKCDGVVEIFQQEFALSWEESFISSGRPAFGKNEMATARASLKKPTCGRLRQTDSGAVEIQEDPDGACLFWDKPRHNHYYYVGVDAARGQSEGDFGAITVLDGTTLEVVARYSDRVPPRKLAKVANDLGRFYNRAMVIIELTGNLGLEVQTEMRDVLRYTNFYRWRGRDDKANKIVTGKTIGWETNYRTRDMLFINFREALRVGLQVRDEGVHIQMQAAQDTVTDGFVVKFKNDDLLFSSMLANMACRQWPPPNMQASKSPFSPDAAKQTTGLPMKVKTGAVNEQLKAHFKEIQKEMKRDARRRATAGAEARLDF